MTEASQHPLRRWMRVQDPEASYEAVVEKLEKLGRQTSAAYLRQIACGARSPSVEFAEDLATVIGGGPAVAVEMMKFSPAPTADSKAAS